jgi:hypothetical protein
MRIHLSNKFSLKFRRLLRKRQIFFTEYTFHVLHPSENKMQNAEKLKSGNDQLKTEELITVFLNGIVENWQQ